MRYLTPRTAWSRLAPTWVATSIDSRLKTATIVAIPNNNKLLRNEDRGRLVRRPGGAVKSFLPGDKRKLSGVRTCVT